MFFIAHPRQVDCFIGNADTLSTNSRNVYKNKQISTEWNFYWNCFVDRFVNIQELLSIMVYNWEIHHATRFVNIYYPELSGSISKHEEQSN